MQNVIYQYCSIFRMLLDRRVTSTPRRVLSQLAQSGKQRLPGEIRSSLSGLVPGLKGIRFVHKWLDGERITRHRGQWVINSFLPPFPGPAYDRMFENLISGRRLSPVSAFLAVSDTCPYSCWHCSFKNRPAGNLNTAEWIQIIENLHGLGASIIGFTGGEPCGREDLPLLIAAASGGGAATIVFSSGAGVDRRLLEKLNAAGLWAFCVSLDHPSAEVHDRLRGAPGSHEQACRVLAWSREAGFYTMAGTVATRSLVENGVLPAIHELARRLGAHELRIVEPMPCGLLSRADGTALLETKHIEAIRTFHVTTNRKRLQPKVCAFNQVESPELFGCGAGTQHLFIDSAGEVCPCDFTAMSFGNAARTPLAQVWARMSSAMGNPRRHCFIQKNHGLLLKHGDGRFPLSPEQSLRVCEEAGTEPLPEYFQQLSARKE